MNKRQSRNRSGKTQAPKKRIEELTLQQLDARKQRMKNEITNLNKRIGEIREKLKRIERGEYTIDKLIEPLESELRQTLKTLKDFRAIEANITNELERRLSSEA